MAITFFSWSLATTSIESQEREIQQKGGRPINAIQVSMGCSFERLELFCVALDGMANDLENTSART